MRTTLLLLLLSFLLTACDNLQTKPAAEPPAQVITATEQIQALLQQAKASKSPIKESLRLDAADLLLSEGQRDLVNQILNKIPADRLPLDIYAHYVELSCRLYIQRGLYQQALAIIDSPRLQQHSDSLPQHTQFNLSLLRAEVFALLGNHLASAQQRVFIDPLLSADSQHSNRQAIWGSLMQVSMAELNQAVTTSPQGEYQGWLKLAVIAKENQGDLDQQIKQLDRWQLQWHQHPANIQLPGGLQLIKELAANRPQQLALLLPLSGKLAPFGKSIRDGFLAELYKTRNRNGQVPRIKIYDTELTTDFLAQYQQAVNEGAELIIGPLDKQRLSLLFDFGPLPVPTLALNRLDNYGQAPLQLFQFGLAPQDEAEQVADIAYLDNHRKAFIITPYGEWGDKTSKAFSDRWEALGAETISRSVYNGQKDYSKTIKEALLLQASEDRAKRVEKLIGEALEFSPRRREDIDMVLLLARPQQARSLKPLLAYHYAGDLPVYGTSSLYGGYDEPDKNRDINGIRFTDIPWVLEKPSELHLQIDREIDQSKLYQRMYALGIDSFQLYPRLRQLKEIPNSRVYGQTGSLKLNDRNEIERQLLLAQIKQSRAVLIPTAGKTVDLTLTTKDGIENVRDREN